LTTEIKRR